MRILTGVLLFLFIAMLGASLFVAFLLFFPAVRPQAPQAASCGPTYTVVRGDTLEGIAAKCGVALIDLQIYNPAITADTLAPGQVLNIPGQTLQIIEQATEAPTPEPQPSPTPKPKPQPTAIPLTGQEATTKGAVVSQYTVQAGDWMAAIARRFAVALADLIAANPQFPDPNLIYPGQVVYIPATIPTTGGDGSGDYIVQPGDTLYAIAVSFGVSLDDLIAANPEITNPNLIYPGQGINVPGVGTGEG